MKTSSRPALWTRDSRVYPRKSTAMADSAVRAIGTPSTASGDVWPDTMVRGPAVSNNAIFASFSQTGQKSMMMYLSEYAAQRCLKYLYDLPRA